MCAEALRPRQGDWSDLWPQRHREASTGDLAEECGGRRKAPLLHLGFPLPSRRSDTACNIGGAYDET